MIITRSPLRISLGGGGTDLPSYYREHGGFLISAAIDKYVYITLHETFQEELILKYSKMEVVKSIEDIKHPIIREALKLVDADENNLEITSMSDIPAGSGLGSSGSFTTALLYALHAMRRKFISPRDLAEEACHIEIDRLGEPIGKQDQYIAAHGGVTAFTFHPDDRVDVESVAMSRETMLNLEDNLILFFTGFTRSAAEILKDQDSRSREKDQAMMANLHFVKQIGRDTMQAFLSGDLREFGRLMDVHWQNKKKRSAGMSNSRIDDYYDLAMRSGALGGKLIGAGGGGFLLFYSEDKTRLRHAMTSAGLREVRFRFDFEGTKLVAHS